MTSRWKLGGAGALLLAAALAGGPLRAAEVVDDVRLQSALERARERYLAGQPFDRADVTLLVAGRDGRWRRGAVNGDALAYPASCMKLAVLVAAVHWCREQGRPPECLDADVRPMIATSDNEATGRVIDAITGAPNVESERATGYEDWLERRRYVERYLDEHGLLAGQRLVTKTYPSNSGEMPSGFEKVARETLGRNAMAPDPAARLMLAIVAGDIEPQARDYMRSLLRRDRFTPYSAFGPGLPPGTVYESKIGSAYDVLAEIAYAELPNGERLILAAFTNGWDQREPPPYDVARLGALAGLIIEEAGLEQGLPWQRQYVARELRSARWQWRARVGEPGWYEVRVWNPPRAQPTPKALYEITHRAGTTRVEIDQRFWADRWVKLGDFVPAGSHLTVTVGAAEPGELAVGALSVARWPKIRATASTATQ